MRSEIQSSAQFSMQEGWLYSLAHNHLYNIIANVLDQVCDDVQIEPPPQTLTGKTFGSRSRNMRDETRLDVSAIEFWKKYQISFFGVMVFGSNAKSYESKGTSNLTEPMKWRRNENITNVFCKLKIEI